MESVSSPALPESRPQSSTRAARLRVLPVAQIFACHGGEAQGRDNMVTVLVGDERNQPKSHGLRASRALWLEIVTTLAREDAVLADQLREALGSAGLSALSVGTDRPFLNKPSGHPL